MDPGTRVGLVARAPAGIHRAASGQRRTDGSGLRRAGRGMTTIAAHPSSASRKGWLDRVLSVAADVRAGEGAGALLLAANVFVLLACYYVLKTVRESLILTEGGAEVK